MDTSGLFRVDGIVAVVTGGGTGIGLTMAKALAGAGAKKVYILGRRQAVLETAATVHSTIVPIQCDITNKESLQSAVDTVTEDIGYINTFIANSGSLRPIMLWDKGLSIHQLRKHLFDDASMEEFTEEYRTNVTGTFFSFTAFLELLDKGNKKALKGGFGAPEREDSGVPSIQSQVIITSSTVAFFRSQQAPIPYIMSKSALIHLTKNASSNLAMHGIRINALAPGFFPSELAEPLIGARDASKETVDDPNFIPARKFGSDDEMAGTILYLASKAGSYCNGLILVYDGGFLSMNPADY